MGLCFHLGEEKKSPAEIAIVDCLPYAGIPSVEEGKSVG